MSAMFSPSLASPTSIDTSSHGHRVEIVLYHSSPSVDYSWNMKNIQLICQTIPQSNVYSEYPNPVPQHGKPISYSEIYITIPIEKQCCVFTISVTILHITPRPVWTRNNFSCMTTPEAADAAAFSLSDPSHLTRPSIPIVFLS
jgi:hypothetical protein